MPHNEKEAFPVHGPRPSHQGPCKTHGSSRALPGPAVGIHVPAPQFAAPMALQWTTGLCNSQTQDCGRSQIGNGVRCFTGGRGALQWVSPAETDVSTSFCLWVGFSYFCFLRLSISSLCLGIVNPFISSISTLNFLSSFQNSMFAFFFCISWWSYLVFVSILLFFPATIHLYIY